MHDVQTEHVQKKMIPDVPVLPNIHCVADEHMHKQILMPHFQHILDIAVEGYLSPKVVESKQTFDECPNDIQLPSIIDLENDHAFELNATYDPFANVPHLPNISQIGRELGFKQMIVDSDENIIQIDEDTDTDVKCEIPENIVADGKCETSVIDINLQSNLVSANFANADIQTNDVRKQFVSEFIKTLFKY